MNEGLCWTTKSKFKGLYFIAAAAVALAGFAGAARGSETQVTTIDSVNHYYPSWSPDGAKLVYTVYLGSTYYIYTVNLATNTEAYLLAGSTWRIRPDWSPDGTSIAYMARDAQMKYQIATTPSDGSGVDNVYSSGSNSSLSPKWSPNGTLIAYQRLDTNGDYQIYTCVPSVGGGETALTSDATDHAGPMWSPDGLHVVYSEMDANDYHQITVVDITNKNETRLTSDAYDHAFPAWSPDGNSITYLKADSTGYVQIYTIPSTGGTETAITTDSFEHSNPSYSPNGMWILYLKYVSDTCQQICKSPSAGGELVALTSEETQREEPIWSPDGSMVAYRRKNASGKWQLYTVKNWETIGWATVDADSPVSGLVLYGSRKGKGMSGLTAQPVSRAGSGTFKYTLCHFVQSTRWYTGVVVVNLTSSRMTAKLTAYGTTGSELASVSQNILPAGKISVIIDKLMGITNNSGWIEVETNGTASVFDLYGDKIDGGQAAIPDSEIGSTLILPSFTCSSTFWTGVAVANPNSFSVNATMTAYDTSGNLLGSTVKMINARGKVSGMLDTLITAAAKKSGWIEITAVEGLGKNVPANVAAIATYGDMSTTPNEIAAVSGTSSSKTLAFSDFHMVPRGTSWPSWTSLAIVNPGTSSSTVTLKAYKPNGNLIETKTTTLGGRSMISSLVSSLFTLGANQEGWISLSATSNVAGMEFIKLDDSATETWGLAAIEGQKSAEWLCMPHYDCGTAWWARFGIANSTSSGGNYFPLVTLNAYGNDGVIVGNAGFILGYNARVLSDVKDIFGVN